MTGYLVAAAVVMFWLSPVQAGCALASAGMVFVYYRHICYHQFGGVTGDLAGYFLQVCELAMLTAVMAGGKLWS